MCPRRRSPKPPRRPRGARPAPPGARRRRGLREVAPRLVRGEALHRRLLAVVGLARVLPAPRRLRASRSWIVASGPPRTRRGREARLRHFGVGGVPRAGRRARGPRRAGSSARTTAPTAPAATHPCSLLLEERSSTTSSRREASPSLWKRPRRAVVRFFTVIGDVGTGVADGAAVALSEQFSSPGLQGVMAQSCNATEFFGLKADF